MKPKIGVVTDFRHEYKQGRDFNFIYAGREYVSSVERVGGIPLLLPLVANKELLQDYIDLCDGFLLTGGQDVSPLCYDAEPAPLLGGTNLELDEFQRLLLHKVVDTRKPFLAICRGIQLLNVIRGGTLYQDTSYAKGDTYKHRQETASGDVSHKVLIEENSILRGLFDAEIYTNSYHHQSVKDVGEGLRVTAKAADGIIEAVELLGYPFGLGIQWHPELMFAKNETMRPLFAALVQHACEGGCT
ncbi:gamma-glutamyl-gamma-aminobutyrate hydrolase family protein [Lachnospiraceae bacterium ZAX-1]